MGSGADVIVLGAGMVGVSVALHLQKSGRDVVLIDRRGAGEETSYGNAGLIQREAVFPYTFPRGFDAILGYAMNNRRDAVYHLSACRASRRGCSVIGKIRHPNVSSARRGRSPR